MTTRLSFMLVTLLVLGCSASPKESDDDGAGAAGGNGGSGPGSGGASGGNGAGNVSCEELPSGWTPLSTDGAPSLRWKFSTVSTGSEVLVWGGKTYEGVGPQGTLLGDGARLDLSTMRWMPMSSVGAPTPRSGAITVWTGSEMIVWGLSEGFGMSNDGARYDPASDSWTPMSSVGAPTPRNGAVGVWTGSHLVVWGGGDASGLVVTGGRYDPVLDQWEPTSTVDTLSARYAQLAVAAGGKAYVLSGCCATPDGYLPDGRSYDPISDVWAPIPDLPLLSTHYSPPIVSLGDRFAVWGGYQAGTPYFDGAIYQPSLDAWTPIADSGGVVPARNAGMTTLDGSLFVVGCSGSSAQSCSANVAGRYDVATDSWSEVPVGSVLGPPRGFWGGTAAVVETDCGVVVWGGYDTNQVYAEGAIYKP